MQTNEVIPAAEVKEHETRITTLHSQMEAITITNEQELNSVAEHIATVKEAKKQVTEVRDKYIAPAKSIIEHAKATFDPFIKKCEEVEAMLKSKAQVFMEAEEKRLADAKEKEIGKVESGYQKPETAAKKIAAMPEAKKTADTGSSTLTLKKVKEVEIVDEKAIPDEYYKPRELDMVKIKKVALAGVEIPGVKVVEKSQMASRAR
jgi:hypothetical protein